MGWDGMGLDGVWMARDRVGWGGVGFLFLSPSASQRSHHLQEVMPYAPKVAIGIDGVLQKK